MPDIAEGQVAYIQGSGKKPYELKNVGGVYSCSCPAWRNQSLPIERRTCKHLKKYRGEQLEAQRVGENGTPAPAKPAKEKEVEEAPVLLAHV